MPERMEHADAQRPVVLVVDDAPSSLGMLCDTLEGEGYTVLVARDGDAALLRLELVAPDAILLDAVMPGLSGFDTCRLIKANPALAHIPVIFMTGLSETPHVLEGFSCGGVDYVVKPLRAQEVAARLHTHTRNARMTRLAREAVDVAGFGVLLVDARGRVAWRSPQAELWLQTMDGVAEEGRLPDPIYAALDGGTGQGFLSLTGVHLSVRNMGRVGMGETMLLLEQRSANAAAPSRLADAALTPRETEVLSWLAKGKTNRDIGDILGMSHRTVNKHLEHVFEKLGVETRAAAAALATGHVF
ncbi:DNA-binding response regulator [Polaromonas eurypsychrophila]|uniref:DNA-binding response regulator n=2 Tax=Polaromonas eurypsychrophila TaxID=1614635 RepID=A0A916WLD8_9BURK|nr:DNA-binding response regulator [Polaromonas eurypsychrophila]